MYTWFSYFLKGLVFGFTMAAIPGPIFFLIIQRTLTNGPLAGLFCGLGAVTADTVYALVAVLGLSFVMQLLISYQMWLMLVGGLFLLYLGVSTFRRTITTSTQVLQDKNLVSLWLSTFLLTLTNPVTIISYCVLFAGLGIGAADNMLISTLTLVSGVIVGALSVVIMLISFLSYFGKNLSPYALKLINKTAGVLLVGFGTAACVRSLKALL